MAKFWYEGQQNDSNQEKKKFSTQEEAARNFHGSYDSKVLNIEEALDIDWVSFLNSNLPCKAVKVVNTDFSSEQTDALDKVIIEINLSFESCSFQAIRFKGIRGSLKFKNCTITDQLCIKDFRGERNPLSIEIDGGKIGSIDLNNSAVGDLKIANIITGSLKLENNNIHKLHLNNVSVLNDFELLNYGNEIVIIENITHIGNFRLLVKRKIESLELSNVKVLKGFSVTKDGNTYGRIEKLNLHNLTIESGDARVEKVEIGDLSIKDAKIESLKFDQVIFAKSFEIINMSYCKSMIFNNSTLYLKGIVFNNLSNSFLSFNKAKVYLSAESQERRFSFDFLKLSDVKIILERCYFEEEVLFKGSLGQLEEKCRRDKNLKIKETVFKNLVLFEDENARELELEETLFQSGVMIPTPKSSKKSGIHSSVWCTLKNQSLGRNDNTHALEYRKEEMRSYSSELKQQKGRFSEKIVLRLNCLSSVHGTRWDIALVFTVTVWFLFFSIFMWIREGFSFSGEFLPFTKPFWDGAVKFLWLPEGIEMLTDAINNSQCVGAVISMIAFYLLGKVGIGYGIFQTISAFRKHGK